MGVYPGGGEVRNYKREKRVIGLVLHIVILGFNGFV